MWRCLYGRVKLVRYAFADSGNNTSGIITLNVQSDSRSVPKQYTIQLHTGNATNNETMTFTPNKRLNERSFNGTLITDSINGKTTTITTLSEGYYQHKTKNWGQRRNENRYGQQTNGEHSNQDGRCEFNFNSINVRLLETFGFIGTAVAVGIDVRSRINEWMPYQNRRDIHDYCHYHHHHRNNLILNGPLSNVNDQLHHNQQNAQTPVLRVLDIFNKPPTRVCSENDPCLTTIRYCGSCNICRYLFDKLLHLYVTAFPAFPASTASSILNVLPDKSSFFPKVGYNCQSDTKEQNTIEDTTDDGVVVEDVEDVTDSFCSNRKVSDTEQVQQTQDPNIRQRKKSIFHISKDENEQLKSLALEKEQSELSNACCSTSVSSSSGASSITTTTSTDTGTSTISTEPKTIGENESEDIAAVFKMASIEYADQLNNLFAIELMNRHRQDEAMQCWSSCEASSTAFFNMGVAYESGRYGKNVQPDLDRAHDCYALAASMGHREAIYNLALFYLYGKGKIKADPDRGIELLQISANKGMEVAQKFFADLQRQQALEEIRQNLQRETNVENLKRRPLRTSMIRPSASMFGCSATKLRPKHSIAEETLPLGCRLKRTNSAPNLFDMNNRTTRSSVPLM
ncbi:hypothetical protein RDWZM_003588 [Blomia tropicalis]|uniref:Uncharacterized protein n=1 Tax=Blomia tropicalis TaxID=40697 RepID=A0A9Q0MH71_BLOTA|nr:hypothetical protein RDWZM_003588 [Blomia tropicalis]